MNAHPTAAGLDVTLKGGLLGVVQNVAGGAEENDGLILREVGVRESGRIFGCVDCEIVG